MKIANDILLRYLHLFYPANADWLICNNVWDIEFCKCIDDVELNIGVLLYNILSHEQLKYTFEFREYKGNNYYPMKISAKVKPNGNVANICKICNELTLFKALREADTEKLKKRLSYDIELHYETKFPEFFIASCLFKVNHESTLQRSDIIKYLFLKKPDIFLDYVGKFTAYAKDEKLDSIDFAKVHLELIDFILSFFAEKKDSNILGDVLQVLENPQFVNNYNCKGRTKNLKSLSYDKLSNLITLQLPKFNLSKYNITMFETLARTIDNNIEKNDFLTNYVQIFENLMKIAESQNRQKDTSIVDAMTSFQNYIEERKKKS